MPAQPTGGRSAHQIVETLAAELEGDVSMKPNWLMLVLGVLAVPMMGRADPALPLLDVPAKALPVPTADISPGMQAVTARPTNPDWDKLWKTGEETRAYADARAARRAHA